MEAKFHRETAEIYDFVLAARPAGRGTLVTNLGGAKVVPIRSATMAVPAHATVEQGPRTNFGSGWYHDAAIYDVEPPSKH